MFLAEVLPGASEVRHMGQGLPADRPRLGTDLLLAADTCWGSRSEGLPVKLEHPVVATLGVAVAIAAIAVAGSTASAGLASPQLSVAVAVSGDAPQSSTSTSAVQTPGGSYIYDGSITSSGSSWFVNWNLTGSDTVAQPGSPSITTNFAVGNTGDTERAFQILVTYAAPVQVAPGMGYAWQTSLSGVLASSNGSMASLVGLLPAMFEGQINGTGVVLNNPSAASTTTASFFGPSVNNYAGPIPNGPNIATIGYLMTFSLSAHSTAVFNGSWSGTVVPAPGALALFGLMGFAGRYRRG
jgi:hypothetical protein